MKLLNKTLKTIAYLSISLLLALGSTAHAGYEKASLTPEITAPAKTPAKVDLTYNIYAGGMKALFATLDMDVDKRAYDVALTAKTQGLIGKLFPWSATYTTSGHTEDGKLVPSIHTATSAWRNKSKTTEMNYDPKGNLLKTTKQEGTKTTVNRDIKPELTQETVDLLTGALLLFQSADGVDKCDGSFPVFDGKRRFNITLTNAGMDTIRKTDYSRFSGAALKCTVKVEPVAGFKDKDKQRGWMAVQNHTEERKKPPTLWLARLTEKGPVVPVRMEISSEYGAVVAHLTSAEDK